jgi:hypothetical protein
VRLGRSLSPSAVPDADVVPAGWTRIFHETLAGTGYTTFFMLTPH